MRSITMQFSRRWLVLGAALALAIPSWAETPGTVEVAGVKYDTSIQVGNTKLVLNGAGVRYKAIFKVYTAGLYLTAKAPTPEAVFNASGPRRMHIVMLREIDANELGKLFTKGMQDNASKDEFSKSIPGTIKMGEMFAARHKLQAGDNFSVDYTPGVGTVILVNGQPQIEPIKEPEFFTALMRIWLGQHPADARLKDALLGKSAPSAGGRDT